MCRKGFFLAPAKLNLFLKVLGKREDGYHNILSLIQPVTLFDEIHIELEEQGSFEIALEIEGETKLPKDNSNLALRAAAEFFNFYPWKGNVRITLKKHIPIAAGLGGGSSDAATTLLALNSIFGYPVPWANIYDMARGLGADVPGLLFRRPCLISGIGDIVTPLRIDPGTWYVIVVPDIEVSTAWAYGQLKMELTTPCIPYINFQDRTWLMGNLENDLETVTIRAYPEVQKVKLLLTELGAKRC
jgi:4-diphosphocytidyl-2-C-methyl-D-erythritol kinase